MPKDKPGRTLVKVAFLEWPHGEHRLWHASVLPAKALCCANVAGGIGFLVIAVVLHQNAHDAQLRTHTLSYMPHNSVHTAPGKCTRALPSTAAAWGSCSPRAQQRRPLHCFLQLSSGQQDCRCAVVDVAARVCSKPCEECALCTLLWIVNAYQCQCLLLRAPLFRASHTRHLSGIVGSQGRNDFDR